MPRIVAATAEGLWVDGRVVDPFAARCLAVDGATLWAGGDGVRRSDDAGLTWRAAGLEGRRVRSLFAAGGRALAGTKPAAVWELAGDEWRPLAPFPGARSWFWATPAEPPFREPAVCGLAAAGDVVLAGIEAGALVRSTDGGRTWSGHRRGASRDCHGILLVGGSAFEVGGTRPLTVSHDLGATWRWPRDGLHGRYGWSAAVADGDVFLGAGQVRNAHRPGERGWLYRGDGAGRWHVLAGPLPALPHVAAANGLVAIAVGSELRVSTDRGATWEHRAALPSRPSALAIA